MKTRPPPPAKTAPDRETRRWFGHPALSLVIAASWLLLQGSVELVHILWAVIVGLVLPWLVHGFIGAGLRPRAPWLALRLLGVVLRDIVVANVAVARIVLNPRKDPQPAWVRVPYTLQEPLAVMLLATIITNTPGTVSCVVDEERREILVHALDAPDPQAIVDDIVQRYEQPLKEILG
ncbi:Na+/H+ antiporter subunit E [Ramlibacter sp. AW1]|uniref:Na+/H+ antiporter subunit E n=1 Tax=Ramlibacter aurantiacus TaxID=2801330 RepID=A0A937D677_9BURK|nr:Na+/H+ antiporter subunit E [Ramlibacter aurantiacus]MBL0419526.1 Na+/H+ antiporter subunit E [Ramlibacter aurantiacus]